MKSSHSGWYWKCEIPGRLDTHINHIFIKIQIKFFKKKEDRQLILTWSLKKSIIKEIPFELHFKYWELKIKGKRVQILRERNHKFKYKEHRSGSCSLVKNSVKQEYSIWGAEKGWRRKRRLGPESEKTNPRWGGIYPESQQRSAKK